MSKRFPEPWKAREIFRMLQRARSEMSQLTLSTGPENDWREAHLMAAAPMMYSLLREFGGEGGDGFCDGCGRSIASGATHSECCRIAGIIQSVEVDA